jgi:hypothetical protein
VPAPMKKNSTAHFIVTIAILLGIFVAKPLSAADDKPIGYFFMSGLFAGEKNLSYSIEDDRLRDTMNSQKSYMTDVHGPYRTRIGAKRAMRELKRNSKENIYFTHIYRL